MRRLLPLSLLVLAACSDGPSAPSGPTPTPTPAPTPATTPTPAPTPTPTPTPAPTPPTPTVIRAAQISGFHGHSASGTSEIVQNGSDYSLEFRNNFRIDSGNNDVYLTNDANSGPGGLNLGALRATSGAQSYRMPNDGSAYRYVVLWCRPFQITIGVGELR